MNISFTVFLFLLFSCSGYKLSHHNDPCKGERIDVSSILPLWEKEFQASTTLGLGKKIRMNLKKQTSIDFPVPPEKQLMDSHQAFAGIIPLENIKESGLYLFVAKERIWFDMASDSGQALKAKKFEMFRGCPILKAVAFSLKKGGTYTLQVSSSTKEVVDILFFKQHQ